MPYWGINTSGASSFTPNWCRAMGGTLPNVDNMILRRVGLRVGATHTQQIRMAVYTGGSLTTGPAGASLLIDFGVTSGTGTNEWSYIETDSLIYLPKNVVAWVAFRNDGGLSTLASTTSPAGSDFQSARGRWTSVDLDGDETSAYPSTWPTDSGGSFADFWYSVQLVYIVQHQGGLLFETPKETYLSSVTTFTPPSQATVCFWLNPYFLGYIQCIIGNANNWEVAIDANGYLANDLKQGTGQVLSNTLLLESTLYHIVCTVDNSDNATIYINGILDNSGSQSDGTPSTASLQIGFRPGAPITGYLSAYVEDVRIYNRVLSANEVSTIYACKGVDGIVHGLLHRWLLDEGSEFAVASGTGAVKDSGPGQLNMIPNNSPLYSGSQLKFKRVG